MFSLKPMRAEGRETRPKSSPVATASPSTPVSASRAATIFAPIPLGAMLPYPTVVSVWELKKNVSTKRPHGGGCVDALQLVGPDRVVHAREDRIDHEVPEEQDREEGPHRRIDQHASRDENRATSTRAGER